MNNQKNTEGRGSNVSELPASFFRELVGVFLDASPYILFGFAVAACIQIFLPVTAVQRLFGRGRVRSIFAASLLGIPLPLCSCSVLPTRFSYRTSQIARSDTRPQCSGATSLAPLYIKLSIAVLTTMMVNVVNTWGIEAATLYTVLVK